HQGIARHRTAGTTRACAPAREARNAGRTCPIVDEHPASPSAGAASAAAEKAGQPTRGRYYPRRPNWDRTGGYEQMHTVLATALAVASGYGTAGAIVWPGSDDGGYLTSDKAAARCEAQAAKNTGKLIGAAIKCQDKMVVNAFKGKGPIDEQACED